MILKQSLIKIILTLGQHSNAKASYKHASFQFIALDLCVNENMDHVFILIFELQSVSRSIFMPL